MHEKTEKVIKAKRIDKRYFDLPREKKVFIRYGTSFICKYDEDFLNKLSYNDLLNGSRDEWPKNPEYEDCRERNKKAIQLSRKNATDGVNLKETELQEVRQLNEELERKTKELGETFKLLTQVQQRIDKRPGQPLESYLKSFSSDAVEKIIDCLRTSSYALELNDIEVWLNRNDVSGISSPPNNSFNTSSYASALDDIDSWLNCNDVSDVLNQPTNRLNDPSYESASAPTSSAQKRKDALLDHDYLRNEEGEEYNPAKRGRY
jgi:hypothetical protein